MWKSGDEEWNLLSVKHTARWESASWPFCLFNVCSRETRARAPREGCRQGPQPDQLHQANPCEEPAGQAWGSNPLRSGGTGLSENAQSSHWVDGAAEGLEFGFRQC